jgi:inosine/xanthosine triphosphatase
MPTVIVASTNPVKINTARLGFTRMFPAEAFTFQGTSVPSGVSDQPMTDAETLLGARTRAQNARKNHPAADYWVGLEGGVHPRDQILDAFAWIVVLSRTHECESRTATFQLPPKVAQLVHQGIELGHADDQVFGRSNSKQTNGAVGLLTHDLIDRTDYYAHALTLALVAFKNPAFYPG